MEWSTCWYRIRCDAYRMTGRGDVGAVLRTLVDHEPSRLLLAYRVGVWARATPGHRVARAVTALLYRHWSMRCRIELPFSVEAGPGLRLSHRVGGILVNQRARLGSGVTLTPGVVIGNNAPDPGAPTLGDGVVVHVGAMVIGDVTVGDGARIGANAVVVKDVAPHGVVAGVPARPVASSSPVEALHTDFADRLGPPPA